MYFPVADLELSPVIPLLVASSISFFTSMAGVSGAFLLLPFQVSVLGFDSPAVSSTNHLFNVIAIPGGIYRFVKEGRMVWPLTWLVVIGTLPGVLGGALIRITYLPSPNAFKFFVGLVLLYIGVKLVLNITKQKDKQQPKKKTLHNESTNFTVSDTRLTWKSMQYTFEGVNYQVNTFAIISLSLIVGLVGGIYGIGAEKSSPHSLSPSFVYQSIPLPAPVSWVPSSPQQPALLFFRCFPIAPLLQHNKLPQTTGSAFSLG